MTRFTKVASKTEISDLELAVNANEQIVGLQILQAGSSDMAGSSAVYRPIHPMQYPVPVTEFKASESHCHPALDIRREKDIGPVFNHGLQIAL
jgi:hypothetical protein